MLEIYFLLFYIPRKVRKLAKEKDQNALAWSLMAIGAWIGTEVALVIAAVVLGILIPQLAENPFFLLCSYLIPLAGAIFASDLVIKRLRKMPVGDYAPNLNIE
jgi:hypothetical protein